MYQSGSIGIQFSQLNARARHVLISDPDAASEFRGRFCGREYLAKGVVFVFKIMG